MHQECTSHTNRKAFENWQAYVACKHLESAEKKTQQDGKVAQQNSKNASQLLNTNPIRKASGALHYLIVHAAFTLTAHIGLSGTVHVVRRCCSMGKRC